MSRILHAASFGGLLCVAAFAANPTVTIDRVIQRWPWNNKVDVTYTVANGQDPANGKFYRLTFTAELGDRTQTIDGVHDIGASTDTGTHTVTWTLPDGIKASDCRMTARLYPADAPSGDDYLVVNIQTGVISYEGLMGSQEASNQRYNTALYKTTNMVFRKIARTADSDFPNGYQTGILPTTNAGGGNYIKNNSITNWITKRDYYMGIFEVTQWQYNELRGSNPSECKNDDLTMVPGPDYATYRPAEKMDWIGIRGTTSTLVNVEPSPTGCFVARMNYRTREASGVTGFDLPTEVMHEIASRAGTTGVTYWSGNPQGLTMASYCTYQANSSNHTCTVGLRLPNAWGLYDTAGNVFEWCLDDDSLSDLKDAPDPWTPAYDGTTITYSTKHRLHGGYSYDGESWRVFCPSIRPASNTGYRAYGFRMAFLPK